MPEVVISIAVFFMYFKLFPKKGQEIYRKGEFLVNIPKAHIFQEYRKNTAMGRIMAGTQYEQFSLYNEWWSFEH